ncbi:MAG TPA: DNA-processing protein DprA [Phycisphaerales bacterium]|nr:DNA-processing protein DprA [Phycisphaerales bacterium]
MNNILSSNTQAILLLTAPLIVSKGQEPADVLTMGQYKQLAGFLRRQDRQAGDLLTLQAQELLDECEHLIAPERLRRLLDRGFLLSQAVERWTARSIWVVSSSDDEYPRRLKQQLKDDAPPILYGCGDAGILDTGGLAVVGSRHVDDALLAYTEHIGWLAGAAGCTLVSGGARGVDQAAMRGAIEAGGKVVGVLADSMERAVLNREHRALLMRRQLVVVSPYDPAAGFNVGHAMQRNKLIYALADAGLVVSSDFEKGGTWAGAVEQLDKLHLVPVYVRATGDVGDGIESLRRKGALPWPNPETPEALAEALVPEARPENPGSRKPVKMLWDLADQ